MLAMREPPLSFDRLLRSAIFASSPVFKPIHSPWLNRVLGVCTASTSAAKRYKPVARKVRPVPTYMPTLSAQALRPIDSPIIPTLPANPPSRQQFKPTLRLTADRLASILKTVPDGFLRDGELDLLVHVLDINQGALAWTEAERGTFSREFFPDYEIPVIEHVPWVRPPIRIPKALEAKVRTVVQGQIDAGNYEYSSVSYRAASFPVLKKNGEPRMVINLEDLNAVTVRDSALPPRADDFAESFVGHQIYAVLDLFSGYNGIQLAEGSRDLTTFHSLCGALRNTRLPQGFTNAMQVFQRWIMHVLGPMAPAFADAFVDDCGAKGPVSRYNDEAIQGNAGIRRFVFEFASTLNLLLHRFRMAGVTASGSKLILATPRVQIVGSVVSAEGWHLEHSLINKIIKWPYCESVTEVRGFLGTAGVGRKWIKNFALIAKPLTALCRKTEDIFSFGDNEKRAMDELKALVTKAPVLRKIDYELAATITQGPRASQHGLVVLAVDSSIHGAGWVIYQYNESDKHPTLFGSCTFNATESRYSQPKVELYGVFRAMKECRHRIWGVHFRLDVDASYLKKMIHEPDLPNAPMTRWVTYIQLFDFELNHVPADKHRVEDGLSRRAPADEDSSESNGEGELTRLIGQSMRHERNLANAFLGIMADRQTSDSYAVVGLEYRKLGSSRSRARVSMVTTMGEFASSKADRIKEWQRLYPASYGMDVKPRTHNADVVQAERLEPRWFKYHYRLFPAGPTTEPNPRTGGDIWTPIEQPENMSPFHPALLRNEDDASYVGQEFMVRRMPRVSWAEVLLGDSIVGVEITEYRPAYLTSGTAQLLIEKDAVMARRDRVDAAARSHWDWGVGNSTWIARYGETRLEYEELKPPRSWADIRCATHEHKIANSITTGGFAELLEYLEAGTLPERYAADLSGARAFKRRAQQFVAHDRRLWKVSRTGIPRLVVLDEDRRKGIVAEAHNDCGHRGRDPTYRKVADRYYWPDMYDYIAYFVRSCNACQYRSRTRSIAPLTPTLTPAILRAFCFDTIHMPRGENGHKYLLHGSDTLSKWAEGRSARRNDSETWAKFWWQDIICRFGCIPVFICDGGPEFKGAARILLERHGIAAILSTPYHPEGNGIAERDGQTLMRAILKVCGSNSHRWPRHLHAALLAIRTTVSRATGFTPYFLLYGKHCLFPFDLTDRTWYRLAWDKVKTTEDLLAIRTQQIERREIVLGEATENVRASRQRAVDDFMRKHAKVIQLSQYEAGTWVLVHETWLDAQHGNKGALRWAGPYVVHERYPSGSYCLRELDGTVLKEHVAANRLRLFFYRNDYQTLLTILDLAPADDARLDDIPHHLFHIQESTLRHVLEQSPEHEAGTWTLVGRTFDQDSLHFTNIAEQLAIIRDYYTPWF